MAQPSPREFQPYREVQGDAEIELRRILEITAKLIEKRVATLKPGIGGVVRASQLRLVLAAIKRLQRLMWANGITPAIQREIDAALQAGESAVEALTRVAYTALNDDAADELIKGLRAAAESGLKSDAARKKRDLSQRVYKLRALHEGKVEEVIRAGLIAGLSAKELAKDAYDYVSPTAKGGASYAAMRLARTEINNAFHERQIAGAKRPGVEAVKWNLSGSHKVPDECNVYAEHEPFDPDEIPEKPHPQCFCYLTYVMQKPEEFRDALARGDWDDEIARRTRENMALLGQKVGNAEPEPATGDDALRVVPKGLDKRGSLTATQRKEVRVYKGMAYAVINGWLRGERKVEDNIDRSTKKTVDAIDVAMAGSELPQDIQVWRGMYRARRLFGDRFDENLTGFSWVERGYSSTTTDEKTADVFNLGDDRYKDQNVKMKVNVPKGVQAIQVSERGPEDGDQAEIMLQHDLTWTITKDRVNDDGVREIEVDVVPANAAEIRETEAAGSDGGEFSGAVE
jgi:hypothetical protein